MPVTTASAAIHITPVVIKTFFKHSKRKGIKLKDGDKSEQALDDLFYDQAFHIVKAFIELGTKNTVESLQAFTNTHVPAPYWCAVVPVKIPLASCNQAADALIEWFGPEELKRVVGGERWWQIRGLDWIDAEWVTEKEYLDDRSFAEEDHYTEEEKTTLRMEHLDRVMLYVHGGAYFWGSINTHRYQIIRYARKMRGRAFAVNYRKAPQYPWPCPLQDVLAAYFYLTSPPPGSVHKPVPPSKMVFAGDSAGAALCLTALTVLRDLGLPQPAGAILISPWVDLTHSFPSVLTNTATDIIPPHGFIHKPSPLWPVHVKPEGGYTRVVPTQTNPPPQPGHADKLKPDAGEVADQINQRLRQTFERGEEVHSADLKDFPDGAPPQREMQEQDCVDAENAATLTDTPEPSQDLDTDAAFEFWEPKPPKVLMQDPNTTPLELRAQIQLYATTEQLSHPLVSPILQSSLGNLCPLYILAGNGECLRDEIVYMAHKAAHPKEYPTRNGVLREGHRQKENAEKFQTPTKVHLQVFDDMCHVLTVFTFTEPAKYAYRAIAQFVKHVVDNPGAHLERNPFPEFHRPPSQISDTEPVHKRDRHRSPSEKTPDTAKPLLSSTQSEIDKYRSNEQEAEQEVKHGQAERLPEQPETLPFETSGEDIPAVLMVRERVDALGNVRPMEPAEEIEALRVPPQEIGVIKELPVRRWQEGQEKWDRKYKRTADNVIRKRKRYEAKAQRLLDHAREQGLIHGELTTQTSRASVSDRASSLSAGEIQPQRRWGLLDLTDERPPPSAIAGRKDTAEAVALLKKTLYHSAPVTHRRVPKLKTSDAVRAVFDPRDHPLKPPQQSVSEQQVHAQFIPVHGLRMWQSLIELFMRKSSKKVDEKMEVGKKHAISTLRSTREKFSSTEASSSGQPSTTSPTDE
ncbi:alpha/beta-hydrolase [Lentinus tigrinus ALCF2SS1-7]|uniref:Alpha/beta-hydrolase n=1 Tax=Lentinus tigrinus ALCF2SS1-6 TaxID=1328759 RepID=A0A5C2STV6_9APHY|nr:alpha/beta-hydrolase [Lentinus tigrinus ALCF2SS1-6]RPD80695.1 alpha/beta-hydrolase [Lentinus tigrinus ALCF2SS1-7]